MAGFRTPSGGVSASGRHKAEEAGETMAGGAFPIRNSRDLANAKHDVGRAKNPTAARRWINKRAKDLGEPGLGESRKDRPDRRSTLYNHRRSRAARGEE
jgi:hypothetical protein